MKCAQHAAHNPKFEKDEIIQTPSVVAIKRLKDPLTWLKVATSSEKPPNPHPLNSMKPVLRMMMNESSGAAMTPSLIARFVGPIWGPSGADRTQVGPMLAPWILLSGISYQGMDRHTSHVDYSCLCGYRWFLSKKPYNSGIWWFIVVSLYKRWTNIRMAGEIFQLNSMRPSDAYMVGAKPLSKPTLT